MRRADRKNFVKLERAFRDTSTPKPMEQTLARPTCEDAEKNDQKRAEREQGSRLHFWSMFFKDNRRECSSDATNPQLKNIMPIIDSSSSAAETEGVNICTTDL